MINHASGDRLQLVDQIITRSRRRERPVFVVIQLDRLLDDLAQLGEHLLLVVTVAVSGGSIQFIADKAWFAR